MSGNRPGFRPGIILFTAVLCIALVTATVFGVSYFLESITEKTPSEKEGTTGDGGLSAGTTGLEPVTEPAETEAAAVYRYLEYTEEDVHTGDLILVNAGHEFIFPDNSDRVSVYGNKSGTYKISSAEILLERGTLSALNDMMDAFYDKYKLGDVLLTAGYRDYDTQMRLYAARAESAGLEAVAGYIALGGYSEHHTAAAFDLAVYTDDGISMTLDDRQQYSWIAQNCHKYGFVLRYDPEKTDITGILGEKWHFRKVGLPHSYYMKKNNLVLEEYINLLRGYPFDGGHLTVSDDLGGTYEIYTVPLANGEITRIPVPEGAEYNISGSNGNEFIVTLKIA